MNWPRLLDRAEGDISRLPLYGVPFAVKDNIDVAGWPTTAGCPEFAYVPRADAAVVRRLRKAGAIVAGKTNLDQFATGLVGTRSPYGIVPNTFRPEYIAGDRVPVRLPWWLGNRAIRTRDRYRRFGQGSSGLQQYRRSETDARLVLHLRCSSRLPHPRLRFHHGPYSSRCGLVASIMAGFDESDPYSRSQPVTAPLSFPEHLRIAVPSAPEFFGDTEAASSFAKALAASRALGAQIFPSISPRFWNWPGCFTTARGSRNAYRRSPNS